MKVNDGGGVNWNPGKSQGVRKETGTGAPGDKFESTGSDWTPVKPNMTTAVGKAKSGLRNFTGAMTLALGLALTLGATGCATVVNAQAAQKTPIVQTHVQPAAQDTAQKPASYQIGKGLHDIGVGTKEAAQPALDKGKEVGQKIGQTGKQVGQEIGKAGKNFGLGVAKEAKSFWKGLTGKE